MNIVIVIRFCMEDELNGQALHVHHTKPYKITIFKMMALHGTLICDSENWCVY